MAEITFEIIKEIGIISEGSKGWNKELNVISWNGGAPKFDIREWGPNHERAGKGATLTKEEAAALCGLLEKELNG